MVVMDTFLRQHIFFYSLPLGCGAAAADTLLLQPVLSWTSSFVVPMAVMSRLTQSIHLCFGLPLFLLPGGTISRVFLPMYSWSRLFTCPNHLSRAFLLLSVMFSTFSISDSISWHCKDATCGIDTKHYHVLKFNLANTNSENTFLRRPRQVTDCALERLHGRCRHLQRLNLSWCGRHGDISAPGMSRLVTYFSFMFCHGGF